MSDQDDSIMGISRYGGQAVHKPRPLPTFVSAHPSSSSSSSSSSSDSDSDASSSSSSEEEKEEENTLTLLSLKKRSEMPMDSNMQQIIEMRKKARAVVAEEEVVVDKEVVASTVKRRFKTTERIKLDSEEEEEEDCVEVVEEGEELGEEEMAGGFEIAFQYRSEKVVITVGNDNVPLLEAFKLFAAKMNKPVDKFLFKFDGEKVNAIKTPASLDLSSGDQVDVKDFGV